jgi:hypothetical protein
MVAAHRLMAHRAATESLIRITCRLADAFP